MTDLERAACYGIQLMDLTSLNSTDTQESDSYILDASLHADSDFWRTTRSTNTDTGIEIGCPSARIQRNVPASFTVVLGEQGGAALPTHAFKHGLLRTIEWVKV